MRILFVATGRRVSLLERFSICRDRNTEFIGVDSESLVPTRDKVDRFYQVANWKNPGLFIEDIENIVYLDKIDGIISLMDDATNLIVNSRVSDKLLCTSKSLNDIAYDKLATSSFFTMHNILTPEVISSKIGKKLIVRPRFGSGSRGIRFIEPFGFPVLKTTEIATMFYTGEEYTIDCFKDQHGEIRSIVPRLRLETRGGESQKTRIVLDRELIRIVRETILPHLRFKGVICIQCIKVGSQYYFTEINDRFGGGAILSIEAGANYPYWIMQMLKHELIVPNTGVKELTMVRADREFFI